MKCVSYILSIPYRIRLLWMCVCVCACDTHSAKPGKDTAFMMWMCKFYTHSCKSTRDKAFITRVSYTHSTKPTWDKVFTKCVCHTHILQSPLETELQSSACFMQCMLSPSKQMQPHATEVQDDLASLGSCGPILALTSSELKGTALVRQLCVSMYEQACQLGKRKKEENYSLMPTSGPPPPPPPPRAPSPSSPHPHAHVLKARASTHKYQLAYKQTK